MRPFLKWAGGKRNLAQHLMKLVPPTFKRYHEPFLGGGALYLSLRPSKATLSDSNSELITTWVAVRDELPAVLRLLGRLSGDLSEIAYYRVRSSAPETSAAIAARFIYLNKTCFNGLYRVNMRGEFNTPWGRRCEGIEVLDEVNLRAVSQQLQGTTLQTATFEQSLKAVRKGDLVYIDPPYDKTHSAYTEKGFTSEQHEQLAAWFFKLAQLGAYPILTNSDTPLVRKLFKGTTLLPIVRAQTIAANNENRGEVTELVITPKRRRA